MAILLLIIVVALIVYVAKGILIVQQAEVMIIERLGKYEKTLESGLNFIFPILEAPRGIGSKISQRGYDGQVFSYTKETTRIDLRETVFDFPCQNVITKDNVTITINALLRYQMIYPKKAV